MNAETPIRLNVEDAWQKAEPRLRTMLDEVGQMMAGLPLASRDRARLGSLQFWLRYALEDI